MRHTIAGFGLFLGAAAAVLALAAPWATTAPAGPLPADAAALVAKMGPDQKIEMGFTKDGAVDDVEFHVKYEDLPANVREALEKQLPGGEVIDAEIEYSGGAVKYEVTKKIDGKESELLVDATGKPVEWEVQVDEAKVPEPVRKAAAGATGGAVTAWEEIRDGSNQIRHYHVKKDDNGLKYKISISPAGAVEFVRREMVAELEVTIR